MNAFLRYTVLRILVFLGCLLALWLVGLRDRDDWLLLVIGAALLSMVVSFFVLKRFRQDYSAEVASSLERRSEARRTRVGEHGVDEDAEDAELDARRSSGRGADQRPSQATDGDDFR